jgi:hypothetical protein
MQASFILTLDTGSDTDLIGVAADVADALEGVEGLHVILCKPFPHPTLYPPTPPGAPEVPNPLAGS